MLSYRHSFHAGNHADILKHLTLYLVAGYLTRKDKPLVYVDTHAGAGMYQLNQKHSQQNKEYLTGIQKLYDAENLPPMISDFVALIRSVSDQHEHLYPGSPMIAQAMLTAGQRMMLHELHPTDLHQLKQLMEGDRRIRVLGTDGYQGLISIVPPKERRALVLIDPPYEIKRDYDLVCSTLEKACKRFGSGVYLLWYPIVDRQRIDALHGKITRMGVPGLYAELSIEADQSGYGMTGSGMIVLNPPYVLEQQLQTLLPWLASTLAGTSGSYQLKAF
ncbi:23S rRNA (adenine(2030)-N(6))-methyltransferase RlmJ [Gynuella sunshinyii]|uniref:Ribosomal RNA large subunit methyltransferase J n=1 Tax=Gynuella sunshinyii YC6258 TaxID=1445510 RepID=A0A0C5VTR9_9GAMM|nr:23S rRNA (adenine(2030)-N(6))-methyltransferase RlmJ [Gynuella sunshinyii]AJQ96698.1 protein involved in catabolism of external DNA [Gynuella sunshinyii YC6258]